jgi:hypothetical protein
MTDKNTFVNEGRDRSTDDRSPHAHRGWTDFLAPEVGAYLVALALLGHAAWDAYHYLRDRVVARSYAEFCAVLDLVVGAAVLFILFMT